MGHQRIVLVLFCIWSSLGWSAIYKWIEPDGTVHYSDEPRHKGQKPLRQLPGLSTYKPRPMQPLNAAEPKTQVVPAPKETLPKPTAVNKPPPKISNPYRRIDIISPEDGAQIKGQLTLFITLAPVLKQGDYFQVELDGQLLSQHYFKSVIPIGQLSPGNHQIRVLVKHRSGQLLISSARHQFQIIHD